ncbi:MAG: sulfatase-like hydrolase/transferase [Oxalobacter formigenes]|nr:sulfatase-like hydrolase/transferase [Oxalobacter formigenes]
MRLFDFGWNWADLAGYPWRETGRAFFLGFRFDFSALAYLMAAPSLLAFLPLPKVVDRWRWQLAALVLLVTACPLFFMGWVDMELVRFVKSRMTFSSLFLFGEGEFSFADMMGSYALLVLAGVASLCSWGYVCWRIACRAAVENAGWPLRFSLYWILFVLLVIAFLVMGIRGGVTNSKPLRVVDTYPDLQLGNWALNTPFTFIKELRSAPDAGKTYFGDTQKLLPWLNGGEKRVSLMEGRRPQQPQNVVVFLMESLSQDQMGTVNGRKGFTPFLDGLAEKSLFFHEAYANASRSIEGVPAVLGGIPAWGGEPFLVSPYATAEFGGMGALLAERGYKTAFFHGGKKGTMFFDKFAVRAGFEQHFSKEDYPDPADMDTSWGVFDEPYFQYVAGKLDGMYQTGRPFAVGVFSLTAHFPFHLPEKYMGTLPDGPIPVLRSQAYSDLALAHFFETARKKPWFKDTLFVITADHGTQVHLESYKNDPLGSWRIPVIFYHPSVSLPAVDTAQPVQQIDILPSIMDFLGMDSERLSPLGRSVFCPGPRVAVVRTGAGFYSMEGETAVFEAKNGDKPTAYVRKTVDKLADVPQETLLRGRAAVEFFQESLKRRRLYLPAAEKPPLGGKQGATSG